MMLSAMVVHRKRITTAEHDDANRLSEFEVARRVSGRVGCKCTPRLRAFEWQNMPARACGGWIITMKCVESVCMSECEQDG